MAQQPDRPQRLSAVSLYTGAGGLDYGFEAAGFETVLALEMDHWSCETLRQNRDWPVVERSIFDLRPGELLDRSGLAPSEADVLIGGPPCQPFSKSGYWARGDSLRLKDDRARTLTSYFEVLEAFLPKTFLLENVPGLAYTGKSEGIMLIESLLDEINRRKGTNYQFSTRQLNTADYGVPQQRERVFLIGNREGRRFSFPESYYSKDFPVDHERSHFTSWDAIGNLPEPKQDLSLSGKWADLLPSIPEGNNYLFHTDRGDGESLFGWRRRYWSFLLKLAKDRPAWTIQAQPGPATGPFHWNNRRLSARELCRLQTFPDDVQIAGPYREVHRQVGNAVPSLMGEILAREISSQLLNQGRPVGQPSLLPERQRPIPPPEPVAAVADKYLSLRGEHQPHPGTGQGYRAQRFRASVSESHGE